MAIAPALAAATAIPAPPPRAHTSIRDDLVTTGLGAWMVLGLFIDGWAHLDRPGLETFFTPWHAVLYSGFAGGAVWMALLAAGNRRRGLSWRGSLPVGYAAAAAGVVLFGAGGVGDMLWHVALGVETGIDALLSPTHLLLLSGGALVLTAALRSGWARPVTTGRPRLHEELPAVLSLTLVTALAAFFLLYVSVFTTPAASTAVTRIPEGAPGHEAAELPAVAGLAGYLVTTTVLVVPLLLLQRAGRRPRGAITILVSTVALLSAGTVGLTRYALTAAVAVSLAAVVGEVAAARIERSKLSAAVRLAAFGAALPTLLWPAQLVAVAITESVRWPVELWSGVVLLSALAAAALGIAIAWTPQAMPLERDGDQSMSPVP